MSDEVTRMQDGEALLMMARQYPAHISLPDMSKWLPEYERLGNPKYIKREPVSEDIYRWYPKKEDIVKVDSESEVLEGEGQNLGDLL